MIENGKGISRGLINNVNPIYMSFIRAYRSYKAMDMFTLKYSRYNRLFFEAYLIKLIFTIKACFFLKHSTHQALKLINITHTHTKY